MPMKSGIPEHMALRIVSLLSRKGFVIDSDVTSFGRYTQFGESVVSCEAQLRALGYSGGQLRSWSTSFKGPPPAYGAYDTDFGVSDEEMLRYASIVGDSELPHDLTLGELVNFHLALCVTCQECEHRATLSPSELGMHSSENIGRRRGICSKCGSKKNELQVEPL